MRPVCRVDNLTTLMCRLSWNSGSLNLLEPEGPPQACKGMAFTWEYKSFSEDASAEEYGSIDIKNILDCWERSIKIDFITLRFMQWNLPRPLQHDSDNEKANDTQLKLTELQCDSLLKDRFSAKFVCLFTWQSSSKNYSICLPNMCSILWYIHMWTTVCSHETKK